MRNVFLWSTAFESYEIGNYRLGILLLLRALRFDVDEKLINTSNGMMNKESVYGTGVVLQSKSIIIDS